MLIITWNLKLVLIGLVGALIAFIVGIDFTAPLFPGWNLFRQGDLPSATEVHGAKAAMLAIAGASTLFIALIPVENSNASKRLDLVVGVVGAIAVALTGWYWLLSATNGNPSPYFAAIVPSTALFVLTVIVGIAFRLAYNLDRAQLNATGRIRLTWESVLLTLAIALAYASITGIILYLPRWLF